MANVYKGKSAEEWGALGKFGKARAASRGGQTGKEWKGEGADPYKRSDVMEKIQEDTKLKSTSEQTKQFQDWTSGPRGFTDIYRKGKAGEIKGPEYDLKQKGWDVDIKGYPEDWGRRSVEGGEWITPKGGKAYFKPTQEQYLSGGGDTSTGGGDSSFATVIRPDQTPSLREITSDMDLRNMITSIIDKNSPLFKRAKTRALQNQARMGGGRVNSTMGDESVMAAIMDVSIGIATEVTNTYKEAMHKYADTSDAFKLALNNAYYDEMLARVNNANEVKLREMTEAGARWRSVMEAKARGIEATTAPVFDRYMDMFKNV